MGNKIHYSCVPEQCLSWILNLIECNQEDSKLMETIVQKLVISDKIAQKYLPKVLVSFGYLRFSFLWDKKKNSSITGNSIVSIGNDDIMIDKNSYKGIYGPWRLLTYTDNPKKDLQSEDDCKLFKNIWYQFDL